MANRKCRTSFLAAGHKSKNLIVKKWIDCHRYDCPHCRQVKVNETVRRWTTPLPMLLYWREVSDKNAKTMRLSARNRGGYYWCCPLRNGRTIFVSTDEQMVHGDQLPGDVDDLSQIVDGWFLRKRKNGNISHTQKTIKAKPGMKQAKVSEWNVEILPARISGDFSRILRLTNWIEVNPGLYVSSGSLPVDFYSILAVSKP